MSSERSIIPPTSKITVRGPVASSAARNDPAPASLRFVTRRIAPPRPAAVVVPNPIAPGNTGNGPEDAVRTVIDAVPLLPSLVAVIVTGPPAATPVTSPLPFTLAIVLSLDVQVITRPVNGLPLASLGVALSCTICPVATLAVAGATVTVATGTCVTVIPAVPLFPSLVAMIVAEPAVFAVTSPLPFTVATVVLFEDHVTVRPVRMLPLASLSVAVSCCVWPACTLAGAGLTVTVATGAVTVILAAPLLPSLVAVIVTGPPAATPVTSPLPFTLAIVLSLDAQVITRPVSGLPFASVGVALSCTVCPVATLAVAGATVTDATGALATVTVAAPLWPSLVAVIVTGPPAATPVARPLALTLAMVPSLEVQVTGRPASALPFASRGVALNCAV